MKEYYSWGFRGQDEGCDAFIHCMDTYPDNFYAEKLVKALKIYRTPRNIKKENIKSRIGNLYLDSGDAEDIHSNVREALLKSRYLIIVCSPRIIHSKRAAELIRLFRESGNQNRILTLLIEGTPDKAFPATLREIVKSVWSKEEGKEIEVKEYIEPLAANICAMSEKEAMKLFEVEKLRIIAPLLGLGFADLKLRHRERAFKKATIFLVGILAAIVFFTLISFGMWRYSEYQIKQAEKAIESAKKTQETALKQSELANSAINRIFVELPENLKDYSYDKEALGSILEKSRKELESTAVKPKPVVQKEKQGFFDKLGSFFAGVKKVGGKIIDIILMVIGGLFVGIVILALLSDKSKQLKKFVENKYFGFMFTDYRNATGRKKTHNKSKKINKKGGDGYGA